MRVRLPNCALVSKKCSQLLGAAVPWLGPSCISGFRKQGELWRLSLVCSSLMVKGGAEEILWTQMLAFCSFQSTPISIFLFVCLTTLEQDIILGQIHKRGLERFAGSKCRVVTQTWCLYPLFSRTIGSFCLQMGKKEMLFNLAPLTTSSEQSGN